MEIGIIGLGRMGSGMARRLARGGARVIAYDRTGRSATRSRTRISVESSRASRRSPRKSRASAWS